MVKTPTDKDIARFIRIYAKRRELRRQQEEAQERQERDDFYGLCNKYEKKRIENRGK